MLVEFDEARPPPALVVPLAADEHLQAGFRDDHLHLLALAAAGLSVDVSGCASNAAVVAALRSAAPSSSGWVRGWGYDDALLGERSLTAADLDTVQWPVVLHHLTGHVVIANRLALRSLGRDDHSDGVLVDDHDALAAAPRLDPVELKVAVGSVLTAMQSKGVVAVTDATHTNDRAALEFLDAARPWRGAAITAMVGADRIGDLRFGEYVGSVRVGHAKVMADADPDRIGDLVRDAHGRGFPAAVHAMDIETLSLALAAYADSAPPADTVDRLEHCAIALPEQLDEIARLGVHVATQPSFVVRRAAKYRREFGAVEQRWLWPLRALVERGVATTFSSDAPVVPPIPAEWLAAAQDRPLGADETVGLEAARAMATVGRMHIGMPIDQVVRLDASGRSRPLLN